MSTNSKEYQKRYYEEHKEKIRASQRAYYKRQREKAEAYSNPKLFDMREDYRTPTKEEFKQVEAPKMSKAMEYYYANREHILELQRASRKKAKRNARQREYYAKNKEHIQELSRKSYAKRYREKKLSKTFWGRIRLKIEKFVKWK